jgi:adenylate cyclase
MLTAAYLAKGDTERLRQCAERMTHLVGPVLARDPDNGAALAFVALSFAALGQLDRAENYVERAVLLDPDNLYMRYNLAWPLLAFFKDEERALDLLEPALARAGRNLISLAAADRNLDKLRDNPRFQKMLAAALDRAESERAA